MKKWHSVLWVVFFALAASTFATYLTYRSQHPAQIAIAKINGQDIKLIDYQRSLNDIKNQIELYKDYARKTGISMDLFLSMFGLLNPEQAAFDACINNKILDMEKSYYNVDVDQENFEKELVAKLPEFLKDSAGNINLDVYKRYLMQIGTTPTEFEDKLQHSLERETFQNFVQLGNYIPVKKLQEIFTNKIAKKSFSLIKFKFDDYLKKAESKEIGNDELKNFFENTKENYRVPEKRSAIYWLVKSADYKKNIVIDESLVQSFYDKNSSTLFRIAPKVKVRHILFKIDKNASAEKIESILKTAKEIKEKVISKKANFADMAKQYSQDTKTALNGGLINFFDKGTYDAEFEKAAFRLQNPGEISDIIKVLDGYELIQLEQRQGASTKPLDDVRDEIVKTLKGKKTLTGLSADLQKIVHEVLSNENVLNEFVKENNLKKVDTKLFEKNITKDESVESALIEHIFSPNKKVGQYGFFAYKQDFVLFQLNNIQKSFIPSIDNVKSTVLKNIYKKNAKKLLKQDINTAKRSILEKKQTLKAVSESFGLNIVETKSVKKSDKLDDLGLEESFIQSAFVLDSGDQVLSVKNKFDYCLVQLKNIEQTNLISFAQEKNSLMQNVLDKEKGAYIQAFIASLLRTAKIEKFEKTLGAQRGISYPEDIDI
ncbi:peptidylprolyl isomerase [Candidatus Dependentiae bacterium]|nr:peptidylprolyl isomerase [Candidatus Dependentiae bacterium]